tara:strand:+ start:143 stop:355 length:213 start_codon:yes stop_codon:yes gene_type:complete
MKFILVLSVCSFLTGECKPPVTIQTPYDNWAECAIDASLQSVKLLRQEGKDNVNNFRLAVKYGCKTIYEM